MTEIKKAQRRIIDLQLMSQSANNAGAVVHTTAGYNNTYGTSDPTGYASVTAGAYSSGVRTTYESLTPGLRTYYNNRLIDCAQPNLRFEQFAKVEPMPEGNGKTQEFHGYDRLPVATTALTEGVTPTAGKLKMFTVQETVYQYGYFLEFSDFLQMSFVDRLVDESMTLLGRQAALTRDTLIRNVLAQTGNVLYGGTGVSAKSGLTSSVTMTAGLLLKAQNIMRRNDVAPMRGGEYVAVMHPDVIYDLVNASDFKGWTQYTTAEPLYTGEVGKIGNIRVIDSTRALITNDGGNSSANPSTACKVYHTMVLGKDGFNISSIGGRGVEVIVKQLGSSGSEDPLNQRSTVGWKMNLAVGMLDQTAVLDVMTSSSMEASATAN